MGGGRLVLLCATYIWMSTASITYIAGENCTESSVSPRCIMCRAEGCQLALYSSGVSHVETEDSCSCDLRVPVPTATKDTQETAL